MPDVPWGEWRPDVSDYNGGHSRAIVNVVPRADGYGPFRSPEALTASLPGPCRGYFDALDSDGTVVIFAGTVDTLYRLDNTTYTWSVVSKDAGAFLYSVPPDDQWQWAQFGSVAIATNSTNPVQIFNLDTSTEFADLAGSPPQAKYVAVVNFYLVLSGLLNEPYRVQWSANGDITGWTSGVDQAGQQDFADGGIVRGTAGDDFGGLVFQDNAIRRMVLSPGSPLVFSFDRISEDHGIKAPLSLIRSRGIVFFLGQAGFYRMSATGGVPVPIGKEKFDTTFFRLWDANEPQLMIGANDPEHTRVLWAFKSVNGAEGVFDKILIYDYVLDRGTIVDGILGQYLTSMAQPGATLDGLDASFPSIDQMTIPLDAFQISFGRKLSAASPLNTVDFFTGPTLEAVLETSEQSGGSRKAFISKMRPLTDAPDVRGSVGARMTLQDDIVYSTENPIGVDGSIPARVETRNFKFRNRFPAGQDWTFSIGVDPEAQPTGTGR